MPTIGKKLKKARVALGLTVEDVAHETRIHPHLVLSLEADDFSRFPSVSYAKSFVRNYGHYLGLDLTEEMDALNGGVVRVEPPAGGERPGLGRSRRGWLRFAGFRRGGARRGRRAKAPILLNLILGTLIAGMGVFYFLGYRANSLEEAKVEIARGLGLPLPENGESAIAPAIEPHPLGSGSAPIPGAANAPETPFPVEAPAKAGPAKAAEGGEDAPAVDPPAVRAVPVAASEPGKEAPRLVVPSRGR